MCDFKLTSILLLTKYVTSNELANGTDSIRD